MFYRSYTMKTTHLPPNGSKRLRSGLLSWFSRLTPHAGLMAVCVLGVLVGVATSHASPPDHHCRPENPVSFAVLSDPHIYDTRLGTSGNAFQAYLDADPKLLALSEPILEAALADIIKSKVRFVIISGDLTKDGEVTSHLRMVRQLEKLERAGIQVFVVPGNHDINNHDAVKFTGDTTTPVPFVGPRLFKAIYHRFGYGQAIAHAPDSLSYVAEPAPGLWLLALDSAKWAESEKSAHPIVSGRVSAATMAWAQEKLHQAQVRGKKVIAFMHHGVNLHFLSEPQLFPDFLVDNWPVVGAQLANAGLKVIFTGHYHSQDASTLSVDACGNPTISPLCDIETGSLVLWPSAYRIAELDRSGQLHVESRHVTTIAADLGGVPFPQYAKDYARTLLPYQVIAELEQVFGLSEAQAKGVSPLVVDALLANYAGDEKPSEATLATLQGLLSYPVGTPYNTLGQLLGTLWIDPAPSDNALVVPVGS